MTAVLIAVGAIAGLLCFRFGRRILRLGLRLVLSCAALILCPVLGCNPITLAVVFCLGVPGFLSLLAVYTLI